MPKLKILVADDMTNIRNIVKLFCLNEGYDVIEASNGEETIAVALREQPDIVLLDVMMPKIDGFEVCRRLKEATETKNSYIIMITALGQKEDVIKALKLGADDYIIKPFTKQTILSKLKKGIEKQSGVAQQVLVERRRNPRKNMKMTVTWKDKENDETKVMFKEDLIDLSPSGLSFLHRRCEVCTGYEQGTVHVLCPLSKFARRFKTAQPLEIILVLPNLEVIVLKARVVHVFQAPESKSMEKVGVEFAETPREIQGQLLGFLSMAPA